MKKSLCFILLLIFSGFIFFKGWTTIKVDADSVGIIKSKLKGINETPVIPGKFSWDWSFLIPKNAKLEKFSLQPLNSSKTITGKIPGNSSYTNYSFTYSISLSYSAECVVNLLKDNVINTQEDLNLYLNNASDSICQLATDYLLKKYQKNPENKFIQLKKDEIIRSLDIYKEFPYFDLIVFALTDYTLPQLTDTQIVTTVNQTQEEKTDKDAKSE